MCEFLTRTSSDVAPYTGAWIEIDRRMKQNIKDSVAPYTGAWIEIGTAAGIATPSTVAPYTGAWIEIQCRAKKTAVY